MLMVAFFFSLDSLRVMTRGWLGDDGVALMMWIWSENWVAIDDGWWGGKDCGCVMIPMLLREFKSFPVIQRPNACGCLCALTSALASHSFSGTAETDFLPKCPYFCLARLQQSSTSASLVKLNAQKNRDCGAWAMQRLKEGSRLERSC